MTFIKSTLFQTPGLWCVDSDKDKVEQLMEENRE